MTDDPIIAEPVEEPAAPPPPPPPRRPAGPLRAVLRAVLGWGGRLVLLLALLVLAFAAFLHTPPGRDMLMDQIAAYAPVSGLRVEVGGIEGSILWSATLTDVKVRDADGTLFAEVPRVELGWRPWKWFFTGLDVRHLVLSGGTLYKLPRLVPGDPEAPLLPDFDIHVGRFVIEDLTVAPGVLDGEQRVVGMRASIDIRDGRAMINARGELGGTDRMTLLLDAEPDADRFDLDLDWNAPAGGFLAAMAGADEDLTLRVTGDGGWSNWQGRLLARQGGAPLADARLSARSGQYRLAGSAFPGDNFEGLTARALGREVRFTAQGTLASGVVDGSFAIDGAGVELDADGAVDLSGKAWRNVQLVALLTDPTLLGEDLRMDDARLTAQLDGPFEAIRVPHQLTVGRLRAGTLELANLTQRGVLTMNRGRVLLPLAASVSRVTSGNAFADERLVSGKLTGAIVYDSATGRLTSRELDLRFPDLTARLALTGDMNAGTMRLTGPVTARGLDYPDVGVIAGSARIDATLGGGRPWRLLAQLDGQVAQVRNATLANFAGETIRFNGGISLGQDRPISVSTMRIDAARLQAVLNGEVRGAVTELSGSGRQADYGPFTFTATLAGDGPRARLLLADPYPTAGLRDVALVIAPNGDGFAIQAEGQSLLGPFTGNFDLVAPAGGPTQITLHLLEVAATRVTGQLALVAGGVDGGLLLTGGGVEGRVGLAARPEGQGFDAELTARAARFGGATPLTIASADVDMRGFIAGDNTQIEGTLQAQGIGYGTLFIGRLAANAQVVGGQGHIDAALAGRRGSRFDLLLNADVNARRVAVAMRGTLAGEKITMPRRAVLVAREGGGWELERSQISYAGGYLVAEGRFGGDAPVSGRLALSGMPLSVIDAVGNDLGLGGRISGVIDLTTNGSGVPTGEARVLVDGLTRSGLVLASRPLDLAAVLRLTPDSLTARAVMRGGEESGGGRLDARVTGMPQTGALAERLYRGNLAGTLTYDGPAESLWRLAAIDLIDISGPLKVNARLRGSLGQPSITGSLAGDALRVQSQLTGTDISGVSARGSFRDSRLQLTRFSGTSPNDGRVSGSGVIDLSGMTLERGPSIDIRLAADNARILQLPGMGATVTGPLRIVSDGVGGTIAGRLAVRRAEWRLGRAAEVVDLPDIAITEINTPLDRAPALRAARPWRYLIDASAVRGIKVDGMGLDSEWGGQVRLRGTTTDPRIGGTVRIVPRQGFYTFAGSRFEITRGIINFDDTAPPDPRLDILAESNESGVDVDVTVRGTASRPDISFSSTPALPEEELLSRLLFGGSITEISPTDALQLGAALSSLRGGGGMDPINRLRRAIGLDRLRILPADRALDRGTAVALGKNVTRKFYVEIVTDGQGYNATELEFRVTSWLSLLSSISTVGRGRVEAVFSRDY
ncbi:MAG: translocation/assembly module TamB domain-containing protein [Alteraurantiacibacter sp.]